MKTILIPIDFSTASTNAIRYAASLTKDTSAERIILLKSCYMSIYSQLLPSADFVQLSADDINEERQKHKDALKAMCDEVIKLSKPDIKVETAISELPLLHAIHQLIEEQHPTLLLIGSNSHPDTEESYIGKQLVAIARTSTIPVFIVPSDAKYKKIECALVPCDLAALTRLGLLQELHVSQSWPQPKLMVLNVDPQQKHLSYQQEYTDALHKLLGNYEYTVHYSENKDIVKGILNFAANNHLQLIIALPGRYSFFYNLTHRNLTEAISLNARKPVLILK